MVFASLNCCGTGLIPSRNSESSLCGETLSYKKNWTSRRPKSCTRWPSDKLVRLTSLTTSPCPGTDSCTRPVSGLEPHFVIVVRGIGEHHWHHGAHNGRARKHVRSPLGAILKKVTIWQVHSTRCVPKRQPKAASSWPSPSSS